PKRVSEFFDGLKPKWAKAEADWNAVASAYAKKHADKAKMWNGFLSKNLPENLEQLMPVFPAGKPMATRSAGGDVVKALFGALPNLIGGAADLAPSTKTWIKEFGSFEKSNYAGRNLHF